MRKRILGFTAAIFVVNGMTGSRIFGQADVSDRQPGANTTVDRAAGPAAGAIADNGVREQSAVRDALARAVSATLSDKLSKLAPVITDADKQRLGDKLDEQDPAAIEQIAKLRQAWRAKYNQDFDLRNGEVAFSPTGLRILPGDSNSDGSARIAADRSGDTATATPGAHPITAADRSEAIRPETLAGNNGDSAARDMRNAVIAVVPAHGSLPEVHVPLTRQALGNEWKIDLPDGVDAKQLKASIQHHVSMLLADQQNWPGDVKEGYQLAAHHALTALLNAGAPNSAATPANLGK